MYRGPHTRLGGCGGLPVWNANLGGDRERKRLGIRSEKEIGGNWNLLKKRERGWVGVPLSLNLHLLHGSHDLREELKIDYSKHLY